MNGRLIQNLLFTCHHQFSWPRRAESGDYYQLCVHCGTKYSYDWAKMRRVSRMGDEVATTAGTPRKCGSHAGWRPRERRLKYRVPVLFRVQGSEEWSEGVTENISRSGLLFQCREALPAGTKLELAFEMPAALAGEEAAQVFCVGFVVRVEGQAEKRRSKMPAVFVACSVEECRFQERWRDEAS